MVFTLNTNLNDTTLIYQNSNEKLRMSFSNASQINVLSLTDSVHYYNLYYTDLNGININSGLNTYQLCVGKELGLINFLKIDSFPNQIKTSNIL